MFRIMVKIAKSIGKLLEYFKHVTKIFRNLPTQMHMFSSAWGKFGMVQAQFLYHFDSE